MKKYPEKKGLIDSLKYKISKKETERKTEEKKFYRTKQTEEIKERLEEIEKQNEEDQKIIDDDYTFPKDKEDAEELVR